jgi:hypothetical protein
MTCYNSIDNLPIHYWYKIHDTSNLKYLIKGKNWFKELFYSILWLFGLKNIIQSKVLAKVWKQISNEYVSAFGFSAEFLTILNKQKEIARMRVKLILGDRTQITFLKIAEGELDKLRKSNESGVHYLETITWIEKNIGVKVDEMTCSVARFRHYCNVVEKMNKKDG